MSLQDTVDGTSTLGIVSTQENDQIKKDFSSPIWQKTAIAVVTENNTENKENNKDSSTIYTKNEEVRTCKTWSTSLQQSHDCKGPCYKTRVRLQAVPFPQLSLSHERKEINEREN